MGSVGRYCGAAPLPGDVFGRWNADPAVIAVLTLAALLAWRMPTGRRAAGVGGLAVLAVAFVSPLCALSVALFSARALHHLLIVAVAAPLLARAWPGARAVPMVPALIAATATLWAWHLPAAYDAALSDTSLYWLMQATLLATAWGFWTAAWRATAPLAVAGIVGGAVQMGMLGALLTFAPRPLYASHLATTKPWGVGPLADQQLAGLVMWVVGLLPYAIAAAWQLRGGWRRMAAA